MSKQDSTCASRTGNKRLNILDTPSFCFLNFLLCILKFTEIEFFSVLFREFWYQTISHISFGMFMVSDCIIMGFRARFSDSTTEKEINVIYCLQNIQSYVYLKVF